MTFYKRQEYYESQAMLGMLILGHIGCALAATQTGEAVYRKTARRGLDATAKLMDYRLLVIGAILPDMIDKPLSLLVLSELFDATRLIGHTLMFPLLIFVVWRLGLGHRINFLLPLAIGSALHLLLDGMFTLPSTLLWPFMGWEFVDGGYTDLFSSLPIPWTLPWNVHWLVFSEFLGGLFIAHTLFKAWRERSQRVHVRPPRPPVLSQTPFTPPR